MKIAVVDVGLGNVKSVINMLDWLGMDARSAHQPSVETDSSAIILPGVGAFDVGVSKLGDSGWFEYLQVQPPDKPILGICLGMQLLGVSSEEGHMMGLGRVNANFRRLPSGELPVPHMGWHEVETKGNDPIFAEGESRYYFTHSYYGTCDDPTDTIAVSRYGIEFVAAYRVGSTVGVQFHPEKSHAYGTELLERWYQSIC